MDLKKFWVNLKGGVKIFWKFDNIFKTSVLPLFIISKILIFIKMTTKKLEKVSILRFLNLQNKSNLLVLLTFT